ncbi:uncharacterized protein LOC141595303 [Silene latifolia]|uniref:uncharacterized protein LOC141595303 n=1 Tax=Silene latifolia TaxID=37657 RepID=UPI003D77BD58
MKLGVWNIRGMNKDFKQHEVVDFFRANKLDIMGIMETRVRAPKFDYIRRKGFRLFYVLNNYDHHSNGRLWVIWNKANLRITTISSGNQWIHIQVEDPGCATFQVSFVYGLNSPEGRYALWTFLQHIKPHFPWVCLGDFNCVRRVEERISDTPPNLQAIDDFNEAVYGAGLDDLLTHGCHFTWTNKQEEGDRKWMKLDRVAELLSQEKLLSQVYCKLRTVELSMVYQRAKIHDIQMQDANTTYFFAKMAARRSRCHISRVCDSNGQEFHTFEGISDAFLAYYKGLLGSSSQVRSFDEDIILSGNCLEETFAATLISDVSEDEIHDAVFSIDMNKSPGPDGFSSGFFRQAWSVIKGEFVKAV